MRYLLDTNALSEPATRRPSSAFMEGFGRLGAHACTSVLCVGEMLYGARRVRHGQRYADYLRDAVLPHLPVLDVSLDVALRFGELKALTEGRGRPRADVDLLIAATAIVHGLEVVTRNVRDFAGLPDLVVADWTAP